MQNGLLGTWQNIHGANEGNSVECNRLQKYLFFSGNADFLGEINKLFFQVHEKIRKEITDFYEKQEQNETVEPKVRHLFDGITRLHACFPNLHFVIIVYYDLYH